MKSPVLSNGHAGFGRAARGNGPAETPDTAPLADPCERGDSSASGAIDPVGFHNQVEAPLGQ